MSATTVISRGRNLLSLASILCHSTTLKQLFVQSASSQPSDPSAMAFISLHSSAPSFLSIESNYPLVIANQITVGALCLRTERVLMAHRHIQLMFCAPVFTVLLRAIILTGTPVPSFFWRDRKIATSYYLFRHVCLSVRLSVRLSVCLSVRLSAWNNSASTGRILMKFDVWVFFENLLRNFNSH